MCWQPIFGPFQVLAMPYYRSHSLLEVYLKGYPIPDNTRNKDHDDGTYSYRNPVPVHLPFDSPMLTTRYSTAQRVRIWMLVSHLAELNFVSVHSTFLDVHLKYLLLLLSVVEFVVLKC